MADTILFYTYINNSSTRYLMHRRNKKKNILAQIVIKLGYYIHTYNNFKFSQGQKCCDLPLLYNNVLM